MSEDRNQEPCSIIPGLPRSGLPASGLPDYIIPVQPASVQPASGRPDYILPGQPASGEYDYILPGQPASGQPASGRPYYIIPGQPASGQPASGGPYYILPDGVRGDLPVYHVFSVPGKRSPDVNLSRHDLGRDGSCHKTPDNVKDLPHWKPLYPEEHLKPKHEAPQNHKSSSRLHVKVSSPLQHSQPSPDPSSDRGNFYCCRSCFRVHVQAQAAVPVPHIHDTPEHKSRGDNKNVVNSNEGLGHSPGLTTCTSCNQQVTTDVAYKVGRFAKMISVLFVILGLLMCLLPLLLLPLPLCVKSFKDVHHTCPRCRTVLHVDQKRCRQGRT